MVELNLGLEKSENFILSGKWQPCFGNIHNFYSKNLIHVFFCTNLIQIVFERVQAQDLSSLQGLL